MTTIHLDDSDALSPRHCPRCGRLVGEFALPLFAEIRILCPCGHEFHEIHTPPDVTLFALSPREMDVLRLMAEGYGNREIGDQLTTEESTVTTQVASILRKLDARSRTGAVGIGLRQGIIV